jgi:hypothetical protein
MSRRYADIPALWRKSASPILHRLRLHLGAGFEASQAFFAE